MAKEKDLVNKIISRNISSSGEKENLGTQLVSSVSKKQNSTISKSFIPGYDPRSMYTDDPDDSKDQKTDDSIDDYLNEPESKRTRTSTRKNIFIEIVKDKFPFLNKSTSTTTTEPASIEQKDIIIINSTSSPSITKTLPAINSSNLCNSNVSNELQHLLSESSCDFPSSALFGTDFCDETVGDPQDFLQTPDFYATFPDIDNNSRELKENDETKTSNGVSCCSGIFLDPDKVLEQFEAETKALNDKDSSGSHRGYSFDYELTSKNDKSDAKRDLYSDHSPIDLMVHGTALKSSDLNLWRDSNNFYDQMSPLNCSIGDSFDSDIGFDLRLNQQPVDDGSFETTNFSWINEPC